jgi:hypothetical protein
MKKKELIEILESVRYTTNDIDKVADKILSLQEDKASQDETEYLLSSKANKEKLEESISQVERVTDETLKEIELVGRRTR